MTRDLSEGLAAALAGQHVLAALLAEFDFDSQTIGSWTGYGTLSWGEKSFVGNGNMVSISDVTETQDLNAAGISFRLSGIASTNIALAKQERYQNRPCRLWIANVLVNAAVALEDDSGVVLTEDGGRLLLENQLLDSPYQIFSGVMDVMSFVDNGDEATITLSAENILTLLKRSKVRRYTAEDQKARYPGDRFFDFVAQLQDKEIVW